MKFSQCQSQTYLLPLFSANQLVFCSDGNFDRSEPFQRLLVLVEKIVEEPYLFSGVANRHFGGQICNFGMMNEERFDQEELEGYQSQMEIENIVEKIMPRPEFKHKTSIEDRMPVHEINPEVQPCPLSMSLMPSQKDWVVDQTVRNIDEETDLNIDHLRALFSLEDTSLMVMALGYLIKLVTLGSGFHFEMNSTLKKFAASYLIAIKMSQDSSSKGMAQRLGEILGLDSPTITSVQKQFLVSMNFQLEISKAYLDEISKLLFN